MKEDWKECKLGDVLTIKYGKNQKAVESPTGTIPIYGTGGLMGYSTKSLYDKPSILIGRKGTINKVKYIDEPFWTVDTLFYSVINETLACPKFLYYQLSLIDFLKYNEGTTIPSLRTETLNRVEVFLPPLATQQKIAQILSSLDDKIELNNKINDNLEQQAQAIFKSWFVDCMNSNTKMSDIIDVRDGTHDSPKSQESGYLLVTSKHLEPYSINPTDANFIKKEDFEKINERSKVDTGDILLSMIGTVGIVSLVTDSYVNWAIKNMGLFKTSKEEKYKYFLLNYLKSKDIKNYINQHLAGSTQKYISLSELRNLPINLPEPVILDKYNRLMQPIYEQIIENTKENRNLISLRDTLLPKLMNGEIIC